MTLHTISPSLSLFPHLPQQSYACLQQLFCCLIRRQSPRILRAAEPLRGPRDVPRANFCQVLLPQHSVMRASLPSRLREQRHVDTCTQKWFCFCTNTLTRIKYNDNRLPQGVWAPGDLAVLQPGNGMLGAGVKCM
jgi:hypothetical protein